MEVVFQISSIALVTAVTCCMVRAAEPGISAVMSAAACIGILLLAFRFLQPVLSIIERLDDLIDLSIGVVAPMFKIMGIGIVTQIAGTVCEDAGEKTLQSAVEISGAVMSLYISAPVLASVLDLLEEVLGK